MTPEMLKFGIKLAQEKAQKEVSFRKGYYCKNTTTTMAPNHRMEGEGDDEAIVFDVSSTGCRQPRRNGSAYCEQCSEIANKKW